MGIKSKAQLEVSEDEYNYKVKNAHAVLLLVKGKTLAQAVEVIIGLQGLLLQVQAFLLHFNFFFAVGDKLLFPVVALVFKGKASVMTLPSPSSAKTSSGTTANGNGRSMNAPANDSATWW